MKLKRAVSALLCALLAASCCACGIQKINAGTGSAGAYNSGGTLKPDVPAENGGVMRLPAEEEKPETSASLLLTGEPEITQIPAETPAAPKPAESRTDLEDGAGKTAEEPAKPEPQPEPDPIPEPEQEPEPELISEYRTGGTGSEVPEDSLAPFGAFAWSLSNGKYGYDFPSKNRAGESTLSEMYSFPTSRFEDSNKPPDADNWFFGPSTYDEATGQVSYGWDRWPSTQETLRKYGAIYRGDTARKVIYLTFDCGYEYGATELILDALRDKNAPGTFFLTGPFVRGESGLFDNDYMTNLVRRMLDEGHIVGNHTNTHPEMTSLTVDEAIEEMRQVERDYKDRFPDAPDMVYFRPPRGAVNEWLLRLEAKLGYRTVLWSCAYYDYDVDNQWEYGDALDLLKSHLHPGCVYLLHAESFTNAAILPAFIDWVRAQGYAIEPICAIE